MGLASGVDIVSQDRCIGDRDAVSHVAHGVGGVSISLSLSIVGSVVNSRRGLRGRRHRGSLWC